MKLMILQKFCKSKIIANCNILEVILSQSDSLTQSAVTDSILLQREAK